MAKSIYRFPYTRDREGYPNLNWKIPSKQYDVHKKNLEVMHKGILTSGYRCAEDKEYLESINDYAYTPIKHTVKQTSKEYNALSYPAPGCPERTVATSGQFLLMSYMVLRFFDRNNIDVETICQLANFGEWQHQNGTWHHFLDTMCEAYNVETVRLSKLPQIFYWMNDKRGLVVALLDHKLFPKAKGNVLVMINAISTRDNIVRYYHMGTGRHWREMEIGDFLLHTKALWGFSDRLF